MAKNVKDLLGIIANKIGNDSMSKFTDAEDLSKIELDDTEFEAISTSVGNLLTPDAALNNPTLIEKYKDGVHPTIKKSIYEFVEKELGDIGNKFGIQFEEGSQAKDMLKKIKEHELPKSKDVDISKYTDEIKLLNDQNGKLRDDYEKKINDLKSGYEKASVDSVITNKLNDYQLAEAYSKDLVKNGIFDNIKKELRSKAKIKVSETGEIQLYQKDMPDKLIYTEANKPLTFKDFVDPQIKDYLKKSDDGNKKPVIPTEKKYQQDFKPNSMGAHLTKQRSAAFKN